MDKKVLISAIIVVLILAGAGVFYYQKYNLPALTVTTPDVKELNNELTNIDLEMDLNDVTKDDADMSDVDSLLEEITQGLNLFNINVLNAEAGEIDLIPDLNSLTADDQSMGELDKLYNEL